MPREQILITVRTYPQPSAKYIELVCTGGITIDHAWRRLYPVPLRYLEGSQQFRIWDVIEVDVSPATDNRSESRKPNLPTLRIIRKPKTWNSKCAWVSPTILPSLKALQDAAKTLAPVAVRQVVDFLATPAPGDWTPAQKEKLRQANLYEKQKPLEKVPFEFRLVWKDEDGAEHNSLFMAWEVYQTWRAYRHRYNDPIPVMRDKWMNDICGPKNAVSFFMGNLAARRHVFGVCGIFAPPKEVMQNGTLW